MKMEKNLMLMPTLTNIRTGSSEDNVLKNKGRLKVKTAMDYISIMKTKLKAISALIKKTTVNSVHVGEYFIQAMSLAITNQTACKSFTYHSDTGCAIQRKKCVTLLNIKSHRFSNVSFNVWFNWEMVQWFWKKKTIERSKWSTEYAEYTKTNVRAEAEFIHLTAEFVQIHVCMHSKYIILYKILIFVTKT